MPAQDDNFSKLRGYHGNVLMKILAGKFMTMENARTMNPSSQAEVLRPQRKRVSGIVLKSKLVMGCQGTTVHG